MWVEKEDYLDRVKHDEARFKIRLMLYNKHMTKKDIMFLTRIIDCDINRVAYDVRLRNERFSILDDGTEVI